MNDEEKREETIDLAGEVVRQRRGQTARWVIFGAVFFAALVLGGGWFLVHLSLQTRDELRCLVQRQAQVEAEQRVFVMRQHRRLINLAVEIARRQGLPTRGLEDLRSPPPAGDGTSGGDLPGGNDSDDGNDSQDGNDGRNPRDPPRPQPHPSPRASPRCLIEIDGRCILPSPTPPLALAAASDLKDATRESCARQ